MHLCKAPNIQYVITGAAACLLICCEPIFTFLHHDCTDYVSSDCTGNVSTEHQSATYVYIADEPLMHISSADTGLYAPETMCVDGLLPSRLVKVP